MKPVTRLKSERENARDAELELIIEDMGCAMRNADPGFIAAQPACSHESALRFTPNMWRAWNEYIELCARANNANRLR